MGTWGDIPRQLLTYNDLDFSPSGIDRLEGFHHGDLSFYRRKLITVAVNETSNSPVSLRSLRRLFNDAGMCSAFDRRSNTYIRSSKVAKCLRRPFSRLPLLLHSPRRALNHRLQGAYAGKRRKDVVCLYRMKFGG